MYLLKDQTIQATTLLVQTLESYGGVIKTLKVLEGYSTSK